MTTETPDFIQVPSPPLLIVTLDERHTYYCQHSKTKRVSWQLNSTSSNFIPVGISIGSSGTTDGGIVDTLTIGGEVEHNKTTIQCAAELNGRVTMSPQVIFLLQGLLIFCT